MPNTAAAAVRRACCRLAAVPGHAEHVHGVPRWLGGRHGRVIVAAVSLLCGLYSKPWQLQLSMLATLTDAARACRCSPTCPPVCSQLVRLPHVPTWHLCPLGKPPASALFKPGRPAAASGCLSMAGGCRRPRHAHAAPHPPLVSADLQEQSPACLACGPGTFAYSWGSAYCKNCIEGTHAPTGRMLGVGVLGNGASAVRSSG